jgi:hypothetical protein
MKRIIEGRTYNTETATLVAGGCEEVLYLTREGYHFLVGMVDEKMTITPLTFPDAVAWAGMDPEEYTLTYFKGEAVLYTRLPIALKNRIDALARAAGQSTNAWVMRCLEQGAQGDSLRAAS